MKKVLNSVFGFIIGIYLVGTTIGTPYYTWQDIKEHDSFVRYFFVSPVVGFFNSLIWPYNLYFDNVKSNQNNLSEIENINIKTFFTAEEQLRSAILLTQSIPKSKDIKGDFEKINALLTDAKDRMLECDREVLNTLYSGWGDIALDTFVKGVAYYQSGISENGDKADLARGDALLINYDKWLQNNWDKMSKKLND